ncbi:outer membrane beta-barrel protein [Catenovulum sp. SX2]|uniref:outer membrane beta-barrel protein n=1 Tax=Catenovulum sp. SX2 TaxID=3398614 RepID=UPI003F8249CB
MFKKAITAAALFSISSLAQAQWVGGFNYTAFQEDLGEDISISSINGELGYKYASSSQFSIIPTVRLGFGLASDEVDTFWDTIELEIDNYFIFSVRAQYQFDNGFYLYAVPSYGTYKISASMGDISGSDSSSEFGAGVGVGKYITDSTSIEASFESVDETDLISIGLKFDF